MLIVGLIKTQLLSANRPIFTIKHQPILTKNEIISTLTLLVEKQSAQIASLTVRVESLEQELAIYKNRKNSGNSSMPPSSDFGKSKPNQSLREKSDKKVGGQPGHEGTTLSFSASPDEIVRHIPSYCKRCGLGLTTIGAVELSRRQVIDIPMPAPICTEHQTFAKTCSCGCVNRGEFPAGATNHAQYGANIEAMAVYLNARQYMPYNRISEFFEQTTGLKISTGTLAGMIARFAVKALPMYQEIKSRIQKAACIGSDETGVKINGKNHWMWVWQNEQYSYIVAAQSRGFKTISETFATGLPNAVLVHDRLAAQLKTDASKHQVCLAHLLRDLNYIQQIHQSCWANSFKKLLKQAITLHKKNNDCPLKDQSVRDKLETSVDCLLNQDLPPQDKLAIKLQKKLKKIKQSILCFLHYQNVPPDNNGSERAIRNLKVKQKVSAGFRCFDGATFYAIIRSVIDTSIKSAQNVFDSIRLIAKFKAE